MAGYQIPSKDISEYSLSEGRLQEQRSLRATGGLSNGPRAQRGLQRISAAQLRHGKYTKTELAKAKHRAKIGRRVLAELGRIEHRLTDLGLMPE